MNPVSFSAGRRLRAMLTLMVLCAGGLAHADESEPNDSCGNAQYIGSANGASLSFDGELTAGDVDYFQFQAAPGEQIQIDVKGAGAGAGTLSDSMLGVFDFNCNQIASDDDSGADHDSEVLLTVPDEGILTVAVAAYPDSGFSGQGEFTGTYQLVIQAPEADYLSGKVQDAATGEPLPTGMLAMAGLYRCDSAQTSSCGNSVQSVFVDEHGKYTLSLNGLSAGTYQTQVQVSGYAIGYGRKITVTGDPLGQVKQNFKLDALPLQMVYGQDCSEPLAGQDCTLTYTVTNITDSEIKTELWAYVWVTQTGGAIASTQFTVGEDGSRNNIKLTLEPGQTETLSQVLPLAALGSGATGSVTVFAAKKGSLTTTISALGGHSWVMLPASGGAARSASKGGMTTNGSVRTTIPLNGTVTDQDGNPLQIALQLRRCANSTDALCTDVAQNQNSSRNGMFRFDGETIAQGRYQVWSVDETRDQGFGMPFDFTGQSIEGLSLAVPDKSVVISGLTDCAGNPTEAYAMETLTQGAPCEISYTLSNQTSKDLKLDTWSLVQVSWTGSALGYALYASATDGKPKPLKVTVPAGQSVQVSHPVAMDKIVSGAGGSLSVQVGRSGEPMQPYAVGPVHYFTVVP